jgi:hypothetical protein
LAPGATTLPIEDVESALHNVIKPVKQYISTSAVATAAELCWVNREGQVSYRESTRQQSSNKPSTSTSVALWSKLATPKFETPNTYDALGVGGKIPASWSASSSANGVVAAKPKKKVQEEENIPVLDDWESFEE